MKDCGHDDYAPGCASCNEARQKAKVTYFPNGPENIPPVHDDPGCPLCKQWLADPKELEAQLLHAILRIRELERELAEIKRHGHPGQREDMGR